MDERSGKRLLKTTKSQYEYLLHFVTQHKALQTGKTKPLQANTINSLWKQFALEINALGIGPTKTPEQWKKIFIEWKTNTKRKSHTRKAHDDRYTFTFLSSAVESYKKAQEEQKAAACEIASGVKDLTEVFYEYTNVYKEMVSVEKQKAEALMLAAEAKILKARTKQMLAQIKLLQFKQ